MSKRRPWLWPVEMVDRDELRRRYPKIDGAPLDAGRPALISINMAAKKASGFVSEEQRHTERLTLRLDPEAMASLEKAADEMGCTKATAVLLALEALAIVRKSQGEVMSWGIRTKVGIRMMNQAGVTKSKGGV